MLVEHNASRPLLLGDAEEFVDVFREGVRSGDQRRLCVVSILVGNVGDLSNSAVGEGEPGRGRNGMGI